MQLTDTPQLIYVRNVLIVIPFLQLNASHGQIACCLHILHDWPVQCSILFSWGCNSTAVRQATPPPTTPPPPSMGSLAAQPGQLGTSCLTCLLASLPPTPSFVGRCGKRQRAGQRGRASFIQTTTSLHNS